MHRKILIEQILNDAKEGYLTEGISKHAPQSYVDAVKKDPSNKGRREWSSNNKNTNGRIKDVMSSGYALDSVGLIMSRIATSFHDGAEVPSPEELAATIMDEIRERVSSFNEPMPSPKQIVAAVHNAMQQDVLTKINKRNNDPFSRDEYKYMHDAKKRQIALMKVLRSSQFVAAIEKEYKKDRFKPKNIINKIFGKKHTVPNRLKQV
jgi:hypothetical protein